MELVQDIIGKTLFTKKDNDITGTSTRDPLGLQPIWSYYGRKLIKHLTIASNDIRGLKEVLLCLSICEAHKNDNNEEYRNLILIFEQLFIYSALEHSAGKGIIGADNGNRKKRMEKENPLINSTKTILVNQISLGYYGRYKSPLVSMGIIDDSGNVSKEIDVQSLFGSGIYNKILAAFNSFIKNDKNERKYKKFKASKELYNAICGKITRNEREFWLTKLNIEGSKKNELMCECYKKVHRYKDCEDLLRNMSRVDEVTNIEKLELFLLCIESVFYKVFQYKNIKDVKISKKDIREYIKRFEEFKNISDYKNLGIEIVDNRLNYIRKECDPRGKEFINKIIEYHKKVSEQKNSEKWLELEPSGNIKINIEPDIKGVDINIWGRNYYLGSLRSIRDGLENR